MTTLLCENVYDEDLASGDGHVLRSHADASENATHRYHLHHGDHGVHHHGDEDDRGVFFHGCDGVDVVPSSTKPKRR